MSHLGSLPGPTPLLRNPPQDTGLLKHGRGLADGARPGGPVAACRSSVAHGIVDPFSGYGVLWDSGGKALGRHIAKGRSQNASAL